MSELPDVDVWMVHHDLAHAPRVVLPAGYRLRCYRAGDVRTWVRIQRAAEPFLVPTAATFARALPGDTAHLAARVLFLVDGAGADIGTITAWDGHSAGRAFGQIHWVAIVPAAQGRGLAKPLLSAACEVLRARGYRAAWLETNTRRLPALNLYLRFGFVPHVRDAIERDAWRAVAPHLKVALAM
jgi:ribosomal protein S18 acetylase RimI-like enzyme